MCIPLSPLLFDAITVFRYFTNLFFYDFGGWTVCDQFRNIFYLVGMPGMAAPSGKVPLMTLYTLRVSQKNQVMAKSGGQYENMPGYDKM